MALVNLGSWGWAAGMAIDFGAPALAAAFGIPGAVSNFAIQKLKQALGLPSDATEAETQAAAANADPAATSAAFQAAQSEVTAKYAYLTALATMQAEVAKANSAAVNDTIRAEIAAGVSWWHWRHALGYVPLIIGVEIAALLPLVLFGKISVTDMSAVIAAITPFMAIVSGLLGYVAQDSTALKTAAVTGQPVPGILSSVITAVTPKPKGK